MVKKKYMYFFQSLDFIYIFMNVYVYKNRGCSGKFGIISGFELLLFRGKESWESCLVENITYMFWYRKIM